MKVAVLVMTVALATGRSIDNPAESPDQPSGMKKALQATVEGRAVPPPVQVTSGVLTVRGGAREGRLIEIGDDGIPIIHGVREPDDPNDTQVYRNARIVNNKLWTAEDEAKANQVEGRSVSAPRQARVLTQQPAASSSSQIQGGFRPSSRVAPLSSSTQDGHNRYPEFYYKKYYNNERTGVVAEASFEVDDNISASSEQVVSYTYLAAPKDSSRTSSASRDVVYGSGSAAKPPAQSLALVASPSNVVAKPSAQTLTLVASPSAVATTSLSNPVPFGHTSPSFAVHQDARGHSTAPPPTVFKANPGHFVIKDSTFQAHPDAPTFTVPIPVPASQAAFHHGKEMKQGVEGQQIVGVSSYATFDPPQQASSTKKPVYHKMMEPLRKMGERFYEIAQPVLKPMMTAGHRLSERLQLPERMSHLSERLNLDSMNDYISRTVDDESLPLVAGVALLGTLGLVGLAVAASNNVTIVGKRSVDNPTLEFVDQLVEEEEPTLLTRLEEYVPWTDSRWCSKRIFCDLMTYAPTEFLYTTEKRLELFLNMLSHGSAEKSSLKRTADDVMQAVHRRQCDMFTCGGNHMDSSQESPGPTDSGTVWAPLTLGESGPR